MPRETVFICHATPEDNDFVRWLGARLEGHGYKVWADLLQLTAGYPAWTTIEDAIRNDAVKVLYVASKSSIGSDRTGVRNELSVADSIKKKLQDPGFIIPIKIDDTPFADLPIQVHQLIALNFSTGWGGMLNTLLETLEKSDVPMIPGDRTAELQKWRNANIRTATLVEAAAEPVLTNLTPIRRLPDTISFFSYEGKQADVDAALKASGIPYAPFFQLYIAFAEQSSIQQNFPTNLSLNLRALVQFAEFLEGRAGDVTTPKRGDARNLATALLRKHVERYLIQRGLKKFEASSGPVFYFPSGLVQNDKVSYTAASGRKTNKNVVGRSERLGVNWHLAMKVNVVLGPPPMIRFKPYICFSEDGQHAITDAKRSSGIRRRFCKNWWNQQWRQLQEAFAVFLANDQDDLVISLDGSQVLVIAGKLLQLVAARRLPDDLKIAEDEDPPEPDDDDLDEFEEPEASEPDGEP